MSEVNPIEFSNTMDFSGHNEWSGLARGSRAGGERPAVVASLQASAGYPLTTTVALTIIIISICWTLGFLLL